MKGSTIVVMLALFIAAIFTFAGIQSCRHHDDHYYDRRDSVWFTHMLQKTLPAAEATLVSFESPIDAIARRDELNHHRQCDSIFVSMNDQTMANVCSVLFRSKRYITPEDIVKEYMSYRRVYDGLPEEPLSTEKEKNHTTAIIDKDSLLLQ